MRGLDTASVRVELAVAWAALAVSVLAVYIAVVLGGGLVIGQTEEPHLALSVLATVIVAAGFEPRPGSGGANHPASGQPAL